MFVTIYIIVALIMILCLNVILIRRKRRLAKGQAHHATNTAQSTHHFQKQDIHERQSTLNTTQPSSEKDAPSYVFKKGITRNKILIAMVFGMFITILNQTLLNTALPVINTDFNISASTGQWLMTGFMLVNGILIPVSAYFFQKFSYRSLFLVSMIVFSIGSLVCAIAWNFPVMMTGRVLQAIGAGVLMPLGTNVFMTIFPPQKRGMAMGILGVAMILAPAIGPTLSGYIVENFDWHIMFYGMFVVGLISFAISYIWFGIYQKTTQPKADVPGIIFSTLGFGALLYGFSEAGNKGWGSFEIIAMFIIGVIFITAFVIREMTMKLPMLDFSVLKYSGYTLTALINMIVTMSLFGGMILLPLYLQNLRGFSALDSGLLLLPGAIIMGLMGPIAGKLLDTIGIKPLAIVGLAIMTYATWELTKLTMDTPYVSILMIYILRSFGMSFIMMPIMTAGMNALPSRLISHGNALMNTSRQLAGSIGTAILVTVMTRQTETHFSTFQQHFDKTNPFIKDQLQMMAQKLGGQEQAMGAITKLYKVLASVDGVNSAFWIATALSFLAFVLSFFLKGKSHYISNE
ncbi:DHA2 family efflux MFS transporter permease subunit [Staphylococcus agnetis]|uniref:DHA2 family efflux MFS transporter permease subunit n=1 Tax=Staphylococcus agnetis TaxID=985762 RepID=UPI000CD17BB5|nr:DHA2 family efflux MFS transporter permease subunit [Staphylococcus agnetis]MBY7665374.1 DHA2 family efflux MFS transporter permease subunit [Staphylococcus agnetis]NJH67451.1 DHA2 family efflux MFS transporter permease subunit [Staphylococcus agnetis]NJH79021.1 DHA2 family efflux MFS transporter permease subunit [Staphylococcus agnetis]PNY85882.1 MFS transporter [Staphylococcus agnetis]PTH67711.1 MFS transporter [Staphylococcus agnetis]